MCQNAFYDNKGMIKKRYPSVFSTKKHEIESVPKFYF
jgi:hypothetical protein